MSETLTGSPARNYVGGEWRESAGGETYEKRNPWRPSEVTGVYPASTVEDAVRVLMSVIGARILLLCLGQAGEVEHDRGGERRGHDRVVLLTGVRHDAATGRLGLGERHHVARHIVDRVSVLLQLIDVEEGLRGLHEIDDHGVVAVGV